MTTSGQWLSDPAGRHEYRWHDGTAWTTEVSDGGVVAQDPLPSNLVGHPGRRRWVWWVVGGAGAAAVLTACGALVIAGLSSSVSSLDTFTENFDAGSGDFKVITTGDFTTAYEEGGYRITAADSDLWGGSSVLSPSQHTDTSAQFTLRSVTGSSTAAIGPSCWSADLNTMYAFVVAKNGSVALEAGDPQNPGTLEALNLDASDAPATLRLRCTVNDDQTVRLEGSIDGRPVISGTSPAKTSAFAGSGIQAFSGSSPASWLVDDFSRSGPGS